MSFILKDDSYYACEQGVKPVHNYKLVSNVSIFSIYHRSSHMQEHLDEAGIKVDYEAMAPQEKMFYFFR